MVSKEWIRGRALVQGRGRCSHGVGYKNNWKWGEYYICKRSVSLIHSGHNYWYPSKFLWVKYLSIMFPLIFTFSWHTGTSTRFGFYGHMKWNTVFLVERTQDGFCAHWDKTFPMSTMKYTAGALFILEVLDILFRYISSWIKSNTNRFKNQNQTCSARHWFKTNIQINIKMGH